MIVLGLPLVVPGVQALGLSSLAQLSSSWAALIALISFDAGIDQL